MLKCPSDTKSWSQKQRLWLLKFNILTGQDNQAYNCLLNPLLDLKEVLALMVIRTEIKVCQLFSVSLLGDLMFSTYRMVKV